MKEKDYKLRDKGFRLIGICTAYEQGFGHGLEGREIENPYRSGTEQEWAWDYGYKCGKESASADFTPKNPAQFIPMDLIFERLDKLIMDHFDEDHSPEFRGRVAKELGVRP